MPPMTSSRPGALPTTMSTSLWNSGPGEAVSPAGIHRKVRSALARCDVLSCTHAMMPNEVSPASRMLASNGFAICFRASLRRLLHCLLWLPLQPGTFVLTAVRSDNTSWIARRVCEAELTVGLRGLSIDQPSQLV